MIEELAGLHFSEEEIGLILEKEDMIGFLVECGIDAVKARAKIAEMAIRTELQRKILRGKLMKEYEVRKSLFNLAISGSSPAQTAVMNIIERANRRREVGI